jgi:cell fate (sporulation/competence/biofilm development) regulator YlbF (YheA/YmcA/DUF963 family)
MKAAQNELKEIMKEIERKINEPLETEYRECKDDP